MTAPVTGVADAAGEFAPVVEHVVAPAVRALADRLGDIGLSGEERRVVLGAGHRSMLAAVRPKLNRVLLLELHAGRRAGRLTAATSEGRWDQFLDLARRDDFWRDVDVTYPPLRTRLDRVLANRVEAVSALAGRLVADRARLAGLLDGPAGDLTALTLDAGDSHRGGRTVALLGFTGGRVVYKPRSLAVDRALGDLLAEVAPDGELRVPEVVCGDGYGWACHVEHRYCDTAERERAFYRAIGGWLAVMRLVGGSDLHSENVVAVGPVPVVVDCETLFSPDPRLEPSPLGDAFDRATAMIRRTVLRTGLLPWRQAKMAIHGVDISAIGALPGQQPRVPVPIIADAGTDRARLVLDLDEPLPAANHPTERPRPEHFWDDVLDGFGEFTGRIDAIDRAGGLTAALARFADCEVRVVPRATQAYVELIRMLWHPASLADQSGAVARASDLLIRQAVNAPLAPAEPAAVGAEIDDLLVGDVPVFTLTPSRGTLVGPGGARVGDHGDQLAAAAESWRAISPSFEDAVIRASLIGAYLNEGSVPDLGRFPAERVDRTDIDRRRRALAAGLAAKLCAAAVWGEDGTATWTGPILTSAGWMVRALSPDLYSGQAGVVVALTAYAHEVGAGAADRVAEVDPLIAAAVRVLDNAEASTGYGQPGGFTGTASGVWTWLTLHRLTGERRWLDRARRLAERLAEQVDFDPNNELLSGSAGVIVPLLHLAERTGDRGWYEPAVHAANRLANAARVADGTARWPSSVFTDGIGGFAHGATGIGWALARLGLATGDQRWLDLADRAFAFEETLWRPERGNWEDIRDPDEPQYLSAWCHGSIGIGLAGWDLYRRTGRADHLGVARRGVDSALSVGFGWSHTLCHGDMGAWELVERMRAAGAVSVDPDWVDGQIVSTIEDRGPVGGLARGAFSPGLLAGEAGVLYQLLRMSRASDLPSVLLQDQ